MNFIEINKFSHLHDGKRIIFCKTDYLQSELQNIAKIDNEVVLISGNSDYPIMDSTTEFIPKWRPFLHSAPWGIFKDIPKNIKKWYCQNALTKNPIIEALPLGLENTYPSIREGHGIGYLERGTEKDELLSRDHKYIPTKFIYSNFRISNRLRIPFINTSKKVSHITWEDADLSLKDYFDRIIDYEMILCPIGNGVDTHRLWETLYSHRIPIILNIGDYAIMDLYKKLPIVIINEIEELEDKRHMQNLLEEIHVNVHKQDLSILTVEYWKNKILSEFK